MDDPRGQLAVARAAGPDDGRVARGRGRGGGGQAIERLTARAIPKEAGDHARERLERVLLFVNMGATAATRSLSTAFATPEYGRIEGHPRPAPIDARRRAVAGPFEGQRAVARARARRRAREEHQLELRRARIRFAALLGGLVFLALFISLSIWEKIQAVFGL